MNNNAADKTVLVGPPFFDLMEYQREQVLANRLKYNLGMKSPQHDPPLDAFQVVDVFGSFPKPHILDNEKNIIRFHNIDHRKNDQPFEDEGAHCEDEHTD